MGKFIIFGRKKLQGEIEVYGNKNAVLPIMASSILLNGETTLSHVPRIKDVEVMGQILVKLGANLKFNNDHKLILNCERINSVRVDSQLARKLRASVLLIGPLIARFGKAEIVHPGGDIIGKRSIDTHLEVLAGLGVETKKKGDLYLFRRTKKINEGEIFLSEPSVTASENLLMASSLGNGNIKFDNFALEPHVLDLASFLLKAGAKIKGLGSNKIQVIAQKELNGVNYSIVPDHIEIGTFAIFAAACGGSLKIYPVFGNHLKMILHILSGLGVAWKLKKNALYIYPSKLAVSGKRIQAGPWPMFPTDLMSPLIVLATQLDGQTLFHDPMYESRMFFVDELIRMGAQITICDPHRVIVYGPTKLSGGLLDSPDIRAGVALVLAALIAEGKSVIDHCEIIERGYENLEKRLAKAGANISKHE